MREGGLAAPGVGNSPLLLVVMGRVVEVVMHRVSRVVAVSPIEFSRSLTFPTRLFREGR